MKKILFALAAVAAVAFAGCSKEEESSSQAELVGTVWQGESPWGETFRLQFISSNEALTTETEDGESWSDKMRYEYQQPYIYLYVYDEYDDEEYLAFTGIKAGNAIKLYDGDYFVKGESALWMTIYKQ